MKLTDKTVLITGANRGIGKELLSAALAAGASKVYATARNINAFDISDVRVEKIQLDLDDAASIENLASLKNIDVVINNAGVLVYDTKSFGLDQNMATNYYGTLAVIETLIPNLTEGSIIANIGSVLSLTPMVMTKQYSASKAALHSATQAYRMALKGKGIKVLGIYPATIDTDMTKDFNMQKADVVSTAQNIIKGIESENEYIFPDNGSQYVGAEFMKNPTSLEKMFGQ